MKIIVEGRIRRRSEFKLGPVRRTSWSEQPFVWSVRSDQTEYVSISHDLELAVETTSGVLIKARVKDIPVHLAQVDTGWSGTKRFQFSSVAGIVVEGTAVFESDTPKPTSLPEKRPKLF